MQLAVVLLCKQLLAIDFHESNLFRSEILSMHFEGLIDPLLHNVICFGLIVDKVAKCAN